MAIPQGGVHDITIYQGGVFTLSFQLMQPDGLTPEPFAVGTVGYAQVRNKPGGELLEEFLVQVTPATGTVVISLTSTETSALTKSGVYDVFLRELANPGNDVLFIQGKVTLDKKVTIIA